tara:strand:+ start:68 stop:721 length:654 start_codon:yes stop_codon:yes gene_type:complete
LTVETIGGCKLYLADCADIVGFLSQNASLVTDPPYGINENSKKVASRVKLAKPRDYGDFDWDQSAPQGLVDLYRAKTKSQIIWGGNYFDLPSTSCYLVWDKQNGASDFADCELAYTNLKKAVRIFRWQWNGMIRRGNEDREHPTQKPLELMKWCVDFIPDSDLIVDPFMGSGTTGVACALRGRSFIGIERNKRYFEIACRRIEQAYQQQDLFVSIGA